MTVTLVPHARLQLQTWAPQVQAGHVWGQERARSRKARYPPTARHPKPFLHSQGRRPSARPWGGPRGFNLFITTPRDVGGRLPPASCSPWPQVLGNSHFFPPGLGSLYPQPPGSQRQDTLIPQHRPGLSQIAASQGDTWDLSGASQKPRGPKQEGVGKDFLELLTRHSGEKPERRSGRDMGAAGSPTRPAGGVPWEATSLQMCPVRTTLRRGPQGASKRAWHPRIWSGDGWRPRGHSGTPESF